MNNWQDVDSCYASPPRHSRRAAAAKALWSSSAWRSQRAPQIGPARGYDW